MSDPIEDFFDVNRPGPGKRQVQVRTLPWSDERHSNFIPLDSIPSFDRDGLCTGWNFTTDPLTLAQKYARRS